MALDTYANLQASIADWLNRSDLTTVIRDFITLAEAQIKRRVFTMAEETSTTLNTVAGTEYVALPAGFNKVRSVHISNQDPRIKLDQVDLATLRDQYSQASGIPKVYAIAQGRLYLGPTPNAVFDVDLEYFAFEALSDSNTSNSVLAQYPDLYMRLALLEAARYLSDRESVSYWHQLAEESFMAIEDYGNAGRASLDGAIQSPFVY